MKNKNLLFLLLSISYVTINAQESIYNGLQPELFPVWHRVADFSTKLRSVEAAELSPDGKLAVSGGKFGYEVMLWRVADGHLLWSELHGSEVECVTFSPDSKLVATGGEDYFVRIWEVATGKQVRALEHDSSIDGIAWSNNGEIIATGSENGEVTFWDTDTYEIKGFVNLGSTVNSLQFTKDDTKLVAAGNIQTPNPKTGKTDYKGFVTIIRTFNMLVLQNYQGHLASVKSVRISPDEKWIATASFDSTACIFNLKTGELIHQFKEPLRIEAVAFTADGQYLITGGHQLFISFYRLKNFKLVYQLPTPRTEYLDLSQDGRLLLTSHEDSGLLSLYMLLSNTQQRSNYQQIADKQLNNKDLKNE